jgi:hypothetical protein
MNDDLKGAHYIWNRLVNKKHRYKIFVIAPNTIDKLKEVAFAPRIRVSIDDWFLTKDGTESLELVCESLIKQPKIAMNISWNTIWSAALKVLEEDLEMLESGTIIRIDAEKSLLKIEEKIYDMIDTFEIYIMISGLRLNGINQVPLGINRIGILSAEEQGKMVDEDISSKTHPVTEKQKVDWLSWIQEEFSGKLYLATRVIGDNESSKMKAYKKSRRLINYFRFVLCVLFHTRISENRLKIRISSQIYSNMEHGLCIGKNKYGLSTFFGGGRRNIDCFEVTEEILLNLDENAYMNEYATIVDKEEPSELEGSILTAIYWIGEAQDEYDLDVAFIKYFLALEALFTGTDKPTHSLASRVASINTFGGYEIISQSSIDDEYKNIKKLYKKRSKIIHHGMNVTENGIVSAKDITYICRLSAFSILSIFYMRSSGYNSMAKVRGKIDSLYSGPKA